jgi:hypothetical protein
MEFISKQIRKFSRNEPNIKDQKQMDTKPRKKNLSKLKSGQHYTAAEKISTIYQKELA